MPLQQSTEEKSHVQSWIDSHLTGDTLPPFSFIFGDAPSAHLLETWQSGNETTHRDNAKTAGLLTYRDRNSGLVVQCDWEAFSEFPALEWVVTFRNEGTEDTPILEDVQALDAVFTRNEEDEFVLHRALGSSASRDDFAPITDVLHPNTKIELAPVGGRSSNTHALPFFNIETTGGGVMLGIGWSGQWSTSFQTDDATSLRLRAGMELTHLKLHPGEEIRTPRILLLFWESENRMRGHNLLRRFILAHRTPQQDGEPVTTSFSASGSPLNESNESNQIAFTKRYHELGLGVEYWWLDAGWFDGGWPSGVGTWTIRKDHFPNGLKPLSDAAEAAEMEFLLWFEPERVYQGSWLDTEHPDWVLKIPDNPNGLLNLGNLEARRWLINHISGMITDQGISVYRQDFNMDPLLHWRAADTPERQGMTEIRHIEGLYAFWDELLDRHPGLIIDNCASGGRRIDLETTSRSVPLWRTDYDYFEPNGYQCHTYGLHFYLPCSGTGSNNPNSYESRSAMNSGFVLGWDVHSPHFPVEIAQKTASEYKRIRPFFYGDYYPLTSYSTNYDVWVAFQFHREDLRQGIVLAFRRPRSPYLSARLRLEGLDPKSVYKLKFEDSGDEEAVSGSALGDGYEVTIDKAPGSQLITYEQIVSV
ncbi:MAG: alpha-galactosidase [Candidatus Poribacteria bacterium]|nr:alpha-galactosidase [Candidatus Poribacteria bacterium]MDE0504935.1 alpha-galactosidase [Candidatus Poribacteria bacterium]